MSVFERHISGLREVELFCAWLLLLNIIKFTHVVARSDSSIILIAARHSIV